MRAIVAASRISLQMQIFQSRGADPDEAPFRVENELAVAGSERPGSDHDARAAVVGRLDQQREAARQVLDELLAQPAGEAIGLECHAGLVQGPCLSCRPIATSEFRISLRNSWLHTGRRAHELARTLSIQRWPRSWSPTTTAPIARRSRHCSRPWATAWCARSTAARRWYAPRRPAPTW